MHKIILSSILLSFSFLGFTQMKITIEGQTVPMNGQTHIIYTSSGDEQIVDFLIQNNSGGTLEWRITRKRIDVPTSGWSDFLCWGIEGDPFGGTCYGASQMNSDPWICPTSVMVDDGKSGLLAIHVDPADNQGGIGRYRYYIGKTIDNPQDSVDLYIETAFADVKEMKSTNPQISIYPSPSDSYFMVNVPSSIVEGKIKIVDVLGNVVLEEKVTGNKKINSEQFKNGVYLLTFTSNGMVSTKRFVVRH